MYISQHRYSIERLPDAYGGETPSLTLMLAHSFTLSLSHTHIQLQEHDSKSVIFLNGIIIQSSVSVKLIQHLSKKHTKKINKLLYRCNFYYNRKKKHCTCAKKITNH